MPEELLQTLAECAITFAGFSSVVIVIAQLRGRLSDHSATTGLILVVAWSFLAFLFSILPLVLGEFGATDQASLRISAGLLMVSAIAVGSGAIHRDRRIERSGLGKPPWKVSIFSALFFLPIWGAGLVVAANLAPTWASPLYLVLVISLFVAAAIPLVVSLSWLSRQDD